MSGKSNITILAWVISVVFHACMLAVFPFVRFGYSTGPAEASFCPRVSLAGLKKVIHAEQVIPKPKIKKLTLAGLSAGQAPPQARFPVYRTADFAGGYSKQSETAYQGGSSIAPGQYMPPADFFGQKTGARKICYVVDCSGSMLGYMHRVKSELKDSINKLRPDQYFYIIFFAGDDRLLESGRGYLCRAGSANKAEAFSFIDSVKASGSTNALTAIERAMHIRDDDGCAAEVIYFLTDGFDIEQTDNGGLLRQVRQLRAKLAPASIINTIGFWPRKNDCNILESIAVMTEGQFTSVN